MRDRICDLKSDGGVDFHHSDNPLVYRDAGSWRVDPQKSHLFIGAPQGGTRTTSDPVVFRIALEVLEVTESRAHLRVLDENEGGTGENLEATDWFRYDCSVAR